MEELHLSEIRQLRNLFKEQGLNQIPDRMSVADAFFGTEEHLSVPQLVELLQGQEIHLDEEFVEETLETLRRFGFAQKTEFADQPALYEHHHLDAHHDHLICVHCGRIIEFFSPDLERLQA